MTKHIPFRGLYYYACRVLLYVYQYMKFEVLTFTESL